MSSHKLLLNSSEDSEVMVRQVNLAAAFHDHISCTKISQQSIQTNICGLQTASDVTQSQTQTSLPYETDHIYATESKLNETNSNGIITNNILDNKISDERNQIQKLTEMILAQLDLIQHQQEQLLKKDRQLQGLKQDREALCLRLEKMEKRIAVLTTKVANVNSVNNNNNSLNLNRNTVNSNNSSNTTETDCDQSGSDTIIEDNNSVIGLLTDPTVFAKLYSQTGLVTTSNNINSKTNSKANSNASNAITSNTITTVRIKSEPQSAVDCDQSTTTSTTTSSASFRKNRKRHPEVITSSTAPTTPSNKKRCKLLSAINSSDMNSIDVKKESLDIKDIKETSSDSFSTLHSNKTYSNRKKVIKQKSDTFRLDCSTATASWKTSLTKEILTTYKPYSITVNTNESPIELQCVVNNSNITDNNINVIEINNKQTNSTLNNNNCIEEKSRTSNSDNIEVPNWRLHPVSSCYSLEGTEVRILYP